jgi:hypothetical protein
MSPKYESVPDEPQLAVSRPRASVAAETSDQRSAAPSIVTEIAKPPAEDLVTITVAVPADVRTALKVACAVNNVTIKQATAEAFRMWLAVNAAPQSGS